MSDRCSTPRCRQPEHICLLGKWLCHRCWDKHCKKQDELIQRGIIKPTRTIPSATGLRGYQ